MDFNKLAGSLARFPEILKSLLNGLSDSEIRWKPTNNVWSIMEIVAHIADEEELDFPVRLESTLSDPKREWAPIDPEQWAIDRNYNSLDLKETLARFSTARLSRLQWLENLENPNCDHGYIHPKFGEFKAGDLLSAWAAHDLLHLRQITKRLYEQINEAAKPYKTDYAGDWKA